MLSQHATFKNARDFTSKSCLLVAGLQVRADMARQYEAQNLLLVRLDAKRAMQMHLSIKPAMLDRFDDVCMQELMAVVQRWLPDRLASRAPEGEVHLHEGAWRNLLLY